MVYMALLSVSRALLGVCRALLVHARLFECVYGSLECVQTSLNLCEALFLCKDMARLFCYIWFDDLLKHSCPLKFKWSMLRNGLFVFFCVFLHTFKSFFPYSISNILMMDFHTA